MCAAEPSTDAVVKQIRLAEWVLALVGSGIVLMLCVIFFLHAGALWRDEVNSVELANQESISQVIHDLEYDSFPVLWHLVLRGWSSVAGTSDTSLRMFGLLVGTAFLGALWLASRTINRDVPIVALALLGFNGAVLLYGSTIRGYGMGLILDVLAVVAVWWSTTNWSWWRALIGLTALVLCAHVLYYNAVVVFALCCASVTVLALHKQWLRAGAILALGAITALTLLPYVRTIRSAARWNMIVQYDFSWHWFWLKFVEAVEPTGSWMLPVWLLVFSGAVVLGLLGIRKWRQWRMSERQRDALLFATVFLTVGVIADVLFLRALSYTMQPWYFLVLLAIVGMGTDMVLGCVSTGNGTRIVRLVTALLIAGAMLPNLWSLVHERRTNVDIVASIIRNNAHAGDVVVVSPWYMGTSFQRYYSGPPDWVAVPPIQFVRFQRFDLLLGHMMAPTQALLPVLERMQNVLSSGHRVWHVGNLHGDREPMWPLVPAPNGPDGWHDGYYIVAWSMHIHRFFQEHALRAQVIQTEEAGPVSQYERLPITIIEGWRP